MKIAIIGYGKMGKSIEKIALERGHEIVLKIGIENLEDFTPQNLKKAEIAIEFSGPESAFANITGCIQNGIPVVCGSTGWLDHLPEAEKLSKDLGVGFLYASNFSLGVNLFFQVNKYLARLMSPFKEYDIKISETHHTAKLDAPSGTAITLAEQILENNPNKSGWSKANDGNAETLPIESLRIDPAPGTHIITYASEIDTIKIEHEAHSRMGFAFGAVLAAEFMVNKSGVFSMNDVLGLAF